mgnify:CR=1 FL=1
MQDILYQTLINSNNLFLIDFHKSQSVSEALEQLEKELYFAYQNHVPQGYMAMHSCSAWYCRIVYGVGEGILRKAVLKNLENHPLISDLREGESGGDLISRLSL